MAILFLENFYWLYFTAKINRYHADWICRVICGDPLPYLDQRELIFEAQVLMDFVLKPRYLGFISRDVSVFLSLSYKKHLSQLYISRNICKHQGMFFDKEVYWTRKSCGKPQEAHHPRHNVYKRNLSRGRGTHPDLAGEYPILTWLGGTPSLLGGGGGGYPNLIWPMGTPSWPDGWGHSSLGNFDIARTCRTWGY